VHGHRRAHRPPVARAPRPRSATGAAGACGSRGGSAAGDEQVRCDGRLETHIRSCTRIGGAHAFVAASVRKQQPRRPMREQPRPPLSRWSGRAAERRRANACGRQQQRRVVCAADCFREPRPPSCSRRLLTADGTSVSKHHVVSALTAASPDGATPRSPFARRAQGQACPQLLHRRAGAAVLRSDRDRWFSSPATASARVVRSFAERFDCSSDRSCSWAATGACSGGRRLQLIAPQPRQAARRTPWRQLARVPPPIQRGPAPRGFWPHPVGVLGSYVRRDEWLHVLLFDPRKCKHHDRHDVREPRAV
jgi:hypothetical protein